MHESEPNHETQLRHRWRSRWIPEDDLQKTIAAWVQICLLISEAEYFISKVGFFYLTEWMTSRHCYWQRNSILGQGDKCLNNNKIYCHCTLHGYSRIAWFYFAKALFCRISELSSSHIRYLMRSFVFFHQDHSKDDKTDGRTGLLVQGCYAIAFIIDL